MKRLPVLLALVAALCQQALFPLAGLLEAKAETSAVNESETLSETSAGASEAVAATSINASDETSVSTSGEAPANASDGASADASSASQEQTAETGKLSWPQPSAQIKAEAAIVMDADSQAVLWGKEIHSKRYPASITKILTALVVLDHCSLDETVTFSETAVKNLESGAVTIGTVAGDTLSVQDCLYALLLKSANEVANALAEHVAGSIDEFAVLMNEKAASLGCVDSHFTNPSGLTDPEHVTSAYDMALIACACMDSDKFMALESETSQKLGGTTNYPGGITVTIGHKMLKEGETYYDPRVCAGKTGYTSASGNTLVTMAEDEGRRVVTVVLKDTTPAHYTDTKTLLDFGFSSFSNLMPSLSALNEVLGLEDALVEGEYIPAANDETGERSEVSLKPQPVVTVPKGGGLKDVEMELRTVPAEEKTGDAAAVLVLSCLGRNSKSVLVNCVHVKPVTDPLIGVSAGQEESPKAVGNPDEGSNLLVRGVAFLVLAAAGYGIYRMIRRKKAEERRKLRRKKRQQRLAATENMSDEEYQEYLKKEREELDKNGNGSHRKSRFDVHSKDEEALLKNLSGMEQAKPRRQSGEARKQEAEAKQQDAPQSDSTDTKS